jgi:hypothetical protein
MTTAISPAVTLDSHSAPLPCSLCGGVMTAQDDIDVCVCGSRRVRSQAKPAAAYLTTYAQPTGQSSIGPDGEVHYSFNYKAQHVELDVCPDGHLEWFYLNRATDESWLKEVPPEEAAAASRRDSIRNLHAELLHMLQEMAGVSDAWCVAEMARLDRVLAQR